MKVAFLTGSTHGVPRLGGEARIFHLAKALAAQGIGVNLYGSTFEEGTLPPLVSQSRIFKRWSGGDWYPLFPSSVPTIVENLPSLVRLSQRAAECDIVISELGTAWQALLLKSFGRQPFVLDEHNVEWDLLRQKEALTGRKAPWRRLRAYEKACHRTFDQILVVSSIDKKAFEADGTPGKKMTVVPNGVDTFTFRPDLPRNDLRRKLGIEESSPVVMYMGSMKFFPNIDAAESIFKIIYPRTRKMIPRSRLLITGPGTDNMSDSKQGIIGCGVVVRSSLPYYINCADICIAPLRFGSGTRYKILEWMACGKAVIATSKAVEGIDVTHGKNVILEEDVTKYSDLIFSLYNDHNLRNTVGRNARALVQSEYSWEKCVAPLKVLLQNISTLD